MEIMSGLLLSVLYFLITSSFAYSFLRRGRRVVYKFQGAVQYFTLLNKDGFDFILCCNNCYIALLTVLL